MIVAAAGNEAIDMSDDILVQAQRNNSNKWIVVGAIDSSENLAYWKEESINAEPQPGSNYSSEYCDLMAPGMELFTLTASGYVGNPLYPSETNIDALNEGSSCATPYVTAACALVMAHAPHLSAVQVRNLVLNNVKTVSSLVDADGNSYCVTNGVLSISNVVNALYTINRGSYSKGDVDGDGYVTIADSNLAKEIYFGTYESLSVERTAADVNNSGSVDADDYVLIKRFVYKQTYFNP